MFKHKLHEDEELLEIYRKHEMTLIPKIFQIFILVFIPWYLGLKYKYIFSTATHAKIFIGWFILVGIYAVHVFLVWTMNVYIVTSKRLIHISHSNLFNKTVNETPLDRILNIGFKTRGFFSTLFHYGDVLVQVVGLDQPLILEKIPNPENVKDFIWKMHGEFSGDQKITYTQPEIAPVDKDIPYAPKIPQQVIVKRKRDL